MTTISRSLNRTEENARKRAAWLALYGGVFVFAGKAVAYMATDSTAILSDALESIVNVVTATFLVYSIRLAATPADRNHPYGHGKVEFFAAGVEGTLIVVAGILILVAAMQAFIRGSEVHSIDLGLQLLIAFTVINGIIGWRLVWVGKQLNSVALRADGLHLLTDVWTTVGVMLGLLGVRLTGYLWIDPLVATIVALNILRMGWHLSREAVRGLMDEADDTLLDSIITRLQDSRLPSCIDLHSLRVWSSGALHHVDFHLTVPRYHDAEQLHELDETYTEAAFATGNANWDVIIHFDPCRPRHCSGCVMESCPVRSTPFVARASFEALDPTHEDESLDDGIPLGIDTRVNS